MQDILKTEFSDEFVRLMKNRMITSYYKYGPVKINYENKLINAIESLKLRLEKYMATGNTEFLVDVANFAMIEFMYPQHSSAYFKPTDSIESPGVIGTPMGFIE